jgi:uncharacterized membrane protein YcfT
MLRDLLAGHVTASLWLLLVLVSSYVTGKPFAGIALEFYLLIFTVLLSGFTTRAALDKVLGTEEK